VNVDGPGTVDDLIADAEAHGHGATPRLVTDWVGAGLLDKPAHQAKGRGKGSAKGSYTAHQRRLFLSLLDKRSQGARHVSTLARIPIFIWLYFGDDFVPTRQTARALRTWLGDSSTSMEVARKSANEMLGLLDHPAATLADRRQLREALADITWKGRVDDWVRLETAVRRVFEPPQVFGKLNRGIGHPAAMLTAESVLGLIEARLTASFAVQARQVDEETLDRARQLHLSNWAEYVRRVPELRAQASGSFAAVFTEGTLQEQCDNCGRDLLTIIGLEKMRTNRLRPEAAAN